MVGSFWLIIVLGLAIQSYLDKEVTTARGSFDLLHRMFVCWTYGAGIPGENDTEKESR